MILVWFSNNSKRYEQKWNETIKTVTATRVEVYENAVWKLFSANSAVALTRLKPYITQFLFPQKVFMRFIVVIVTPCKL